MSNSNVVEEDNTQFNTENGRILSSVRIFDTVIVIWKAENIRLIDPSTIDAYIHDGLTMNGIVESILYSYIGKCLRI